jgi:polar amino acid transport system permease protein
VAMSPRERARLFRGIQYAILAVIVVVAILAMDWATLGRQVFNVDILLGMLPEVLTTALRNTVLYTACGFGFGLALGLVLALMRLSSVGPYRWMATGFIEFFRGVPALVVFISLGLGVPLAFPGREIPGGNLGTAWMPARIVSAM